MDAVECGEHYQHKLSAKFFLLVRDKKFIRIIKNQRSLQLCERNYAPTIKGRPFQACAGDMS